MYAPQTSGRKLLSTQLLLLQKQLAPRLQIKISLSSRAFRRRGEQLAPQIFASASLIKKAAAAACRKREKKENKKQIRPKSRTCSLISFPGLQLSYNNLSLDAIFFIAYKPVAGEAPITPLSALVYIYTG